MVYLDTLLIMDLLNNYSSPKSKLTQMIKKGEVIQIRRGLYIRGDEKRASVKTIANKIYGPSYISFEYALSFYGIIPERVDVVSSAVFDKNKNKIFNTPMGRFYYRRIPKDVYPLEVVRLMENDNPFIIATREKALSDTLYLHRSINTYRNLEYLLFRDLRIDENILDILNSEVLFDLSELYNVKVITLFAEWISKRKTYA